MPVFGIFNVPQFCMHAIAHGSCTATESCLWERSPLPYRGLEPASVLLLAFQSDAVPTEISRPTLRAPLSGTFLQKKDVVNQCWEFDPSPEFGVSESSVKFAVRVQQGVRAGQVRVEEPAGVNEGQRPEADAEPVPEVEPESGRPRAEAADGSAGQAALHEDRRRAQDVWLQGVHGHTAGTF